MMTVLGLSFSALLPWHSVTGYWCYGLSVKIYQRLSDIACFVVVTITFIALYILVFIILLPIVTDHVIEYF